MATALSATDEERERGDLETMRIRRDRLAETIQRAHPEITVHGHDATRLPGHLHFSVPGVVSEELILLLDQRGICASAGAACSSGAPQASHVLLAMGVNERMARGALRLTLATSTTDEELDRAAMSVIDVISQLRA
jgi:cysteine desulfurase